MCCQDDFKRMLRERGFRLTPQRELVLDVMHDLDGHATAEQIYERVHAQSPAIDISTVYRTLELLLELRLVAELGAGDGQMRYELTRTHGSHHHLLCRSCGALLDVSREAISPLVGTLASAYGFQAEPEHLVIPGLCRECQARVAGVQTGTPMH